MTRERKNLGNLGEEETFRYLKKNGHRILERNYRNKLGEIDLVASKNGVIIFVEVKTRVKSELDNPSYFAEDNIDWRKQRQLRKLGEFYLLEKNYQDDTEWQIDVVAVEIDPISEKMKIRHTERAVTG